LTDIAVAGEKEGLAWETIFPVLEKDPRVLRRWTILRNRTRETSATGPLEIRDYCIALDEWPPGWGSERRLMEERGFDPHGRLLQCGPIMIEREVMTRDGWLADLVVNPPPADREVGWRELLYNL
jgi:hypothetical protein